MQIIVFHLSHNDISRAIIKNSIICSGARLLKESNIAQSTVGYNTVVDASSFVNKQILRGTPQQ